MMADCREIHHESSPEECVQNMCSNNINEECHEHEIDEVVVDDQGYNRCQDRNNNSNQNKRDVFPIRGGQLMATFSIPLEKGISPHAKKKILCEDNSTRRHSPPNPPKPPTPPRRTSSIVSEDNPSSNESNDNDVKEKMDSGHGSIKEGIAQNSTVEQGESKFKVKGKHATGTRNEASGCMTPIQKAGIN